MPRTEQPDSLAGHFRQIFEAHPELLSSGRGSNAEVLRLYTEMTGEKTTAKHAANLYNIKSQLRSKTRRKKGKDDAVEGSPVKVSRGGRPARGFSRLELLEAAIDECLMSARSLDPEGLHAAIRHLRDARNMVVRIQGE